MYREQPEGMRLGIDLEAQALISGLDAYRIVAHETSDLNERAVDLLRPSPSDRVLEVGFGHGRAVARLASIVDKGCVCGIDVSESMLNLAVRRNRHAVAAGRVQLRKGDCASIPFANANFDGALAVHALSFWSDPVGYLSEIRRVLKPRARLVLGFFRERNRFPNETDTFYGEQSVRTMLEACDFGSIQFSQIGEESLVLATATDRY
jgi:ubiquinone/menaquinone biosynthesis C-methylase UbiE